MGRYYIHLSNLAVTIYIFSEQVFFGILETLFQRQKFAKQADTFRFANQLKLFWKRLENFVYRLFAVARTDHNSAMKELSQILDEVASLRAMVQELRSSWKPVCKSIQQPSGYVSEEVF